MEGSEKQIKWANELRKKFVEKIASIDEQKYSEITQKIATTDTDDYDYQYFRKMVDFILKIETASLWIDNFKNYKFNDTDIENFIDDSEYPDEEEWKIFISGWQE